MSTAAWVTISCDARLTERCLTLRGVAPPGGGSVAECRTQAAALDWHRHPDGVDFCPACWVDRPRYRAGHLYAGIPLA